MAAAAAQQQPDLEAAGGRPSLKRGVSMTGKLAQFADADAEVERILKNQKNFYFVMRVKKDTPKAEIKANYFKLTRLVHPDKCKHPQAGEATAVINTAWDTLSNPVKKTAYDMYIDDVAVDAPEGMSYAEWEASNASQQVPELPKWVQWLLRMPGGAIILALIMLPLTLILLALVLVLFIICLPINICCRCLGCAPPPPPPGATGGAAGDDATQAAGTGLTQEELMAEMAARNAAARKAAGAPPQQHAPMA